MPFVIIRGNINGQIRHGISCSAARRVKRVIYQIYHPLFSQLFIIDNYIVVISTIDVIVVTIIDHIGRISSSQFDPLLQELRWWSIMIKNKDDGCCWRQECLWRWEGWPERWEASHGKVWIFILGLTNASVLCPRKHSAGWQKTPTHNLPESVTSNYFWIWQNRMIGQWTCFSWSVQSMWKER